MPTAVTSWGQGQLLELTRVLSEVPDGVQGVVWQLQELQNVLGRGNPANLENPIGDFNRLYLAVSGRILAMREAGAFNDPEFMTLLTVELANRYFGALRMEAAGLAEVPQSWQVLFHPLWDQHARRLASATAGVNALINYDLVFALAEAWTQLGSTPDDGGQHQDYLTINEFFFEEVPELRRTYLSTWQLFLDRINGLDKWYEDRLVEFARDLAWAEAKRVWSIREDPKALKMARIVLDQHTALVGWALLSPAGAFLQ